MPTDVLEETGEDLTADEFYAADDPDEDEGGAEAAAGPPAPDPDEPPPPDPERAPFGWTRDRGSKEWRPKMRAGRPPRVPPSADELTTSGPPPAPPPRDDPPREDKRSRPAAPPPATAPADVAMPAAGFIARRVDKLYRRAGRFITLKDAEIGAAFIMAGTKEDDEDVTAGEAWEALCRTNPRVRAWVMRALQGGVYWDLVMAHAPILLALLMKESVLRFIPFRALLESWAEPEDTAEGAELRPDDVGQMMDLAEDQARRTAARMGLKDIPPEVMKAARAQAERQAAAQGGRAAAEDGEAPAARPGNRHQRRAAQSRAQRRKAGAKR